jgi:hypothetical protein
MFFVNERREMPLVLYEDEIGKWKNCWPNGRRLWLRPEGATPKDHSFGGRSRQHALKFGFLVEPLVLHRAGHMRHDHRTEHIGEGGVHTE